MTTTITPFRVTCRVVAVSFPKGAPDLTGQTGHTIAPSFARVIDPHKEGRIEVTGKRRKEDGSLTAVLFTDTVWLRPVGEQPPAPEWLVAVLDYVLLGEDQ